MIAKSSRLPYLIVDGETIVDPYNIRYNVYRFETQSRAVPSGLISSQVDIFTMDLLPPRLQAYLTAFNDSDPQTRRAIINVSYPEDGAIKTETLSFPGLTSKIKSVLQNFISQGHQENQTPLYQAALSRFHSLRGRPQVPPLPELRTGGDLKARKAALIKSITSNLSEYSFPENEQLLGFRSYQEFVDAQAKMVDLMDERQIQTMEFIQNQLGSSSAILDEESGGIRELNRFVFDVGGRLIFIFPQQKFHLEKFSGE